MPKSKKNTIKARSEAASFNKSEERKIYVENLKLNQLCEDRQINSTLLSLSKAYENGWDVPSEKFKKAYLNSPDWKKRAVNNLIKLGFGMWAENECSDVVLEFLMNDSLTVSVLASGFFGLSGMLYNVSKNNDYSDVYKAVKRFEASNPGMIVYHVISNPSPFNKGEKDFTLLYVNKNLDEEWKISTEKIYDYTRDYNSFFNRNFKQVWRTYAYVTGDKVSDNDEFGSVGLTCQLGGLVRVA